MEETVSWIIGMGDIEFVLSPEDRYGGPARTAGSPDPRGPGRGRFPGWGLYGTGFIKNPEGISSKISVAAAAPFPESCSSGIAPHAA